MVGGHGETPVVLVVDDDPAWGRLITTWLGDDYRVRTATDGTEALDEYASDVDLVLLDRQMPGRNGYEVLAELRDRGATCPVVMLTGVEPELDLVDVPFDEYLTKPVTESEVRGVVEQLLAFREYDDVLRKLYSVTAKIATLEAEYEDRELEDEDRYRTLVDRRDEYRDRVDSVIDEVDPDTAFRELVSDPDEGTPSDGPASDHVPPESEVEEL